MRYRKLIVPVMGLVPPALAPVIPFPWGVLTLVPVAALLALPSTRHEIRVLAGTVRTVLARRPAVGPPLVSTPSPDLPVATAPMAPVMAAASFVPVTPDRGPEAEGVPDAPSSAAPVPPVNPGGSGMNINGSAARVQEILG